MTDEGKLANVRKELSLLTEKLGAHAENPEVSRLTKALYDVNAALWDIEDDIRDCENAAISATNSSSSPARSISPTTNAPN